MHGPWCPHVARAACLTRRRIHTPGNWELPVVTTYSYMGSKREDFKSSFFKFNPKMLIDNYQDQFSCKEEHTFISVIQDLENSVTDQIGLLLTTV